ncbi:MAG: APC family permease [Kineosporiaceae bacterium]
MVGNETRQFTVTQASFIGVGAMVGAGIFALLGAAGAVAGAAVWLSFLLAGGIAALQGYSFAKLGAKYPSEGGMLEYLAQGFGRGHVTGTTSWLLFGTNAVVTAMVASSFGSYASAVVADKSAAWTKVFACLVVLAMTALNVAGSTAVARVQSVIVKIVVSILAVFAVVTIVNMNPSLLAPSGYPGVREIVSSIALTFFAFLGFGVITFTAKDLPDPSRQLPRAMFLALGIATTLYVGVALGVFGTLTVDQVIASGGTALAEAAKPTLGEFGYVLMVITALFSTTGAVNSGLYPSVGLTRSLASTRQFPPVLGRDVGRRRAPVGLIVTAAVTILLVLGFNLDAIASLGSAVALIVFSMVTLGHFRVYRETGANRAVLVIALASTVITLVVFCTTTLVHEPTTAVALVAMIVLAIGIDLVWTWRRDRGRGGMAERPVPAPAAS